MEPQYVASGRVLRAIIFAMAALALVSAPGWASPEAVGARLSDYKSGARFVVELTEEVKPVIFTLPDPYRVVIDLPRTEWQGSGETPLDSRGLVAGLRVGQPKPETVRLVLDVSKPIKVAQSFVLGPPGGGDHFRLVVDIEPVSSSEFQRLAKEGRGQDDKGGGAAAAKPKPDLPTIVLDAGHGGIDPGTIGLRGTQEKDITLAVARELERQLKATGRYKVLLTRDRDIFMQLRDRTAFARSAGAGLFISIHADSIADGSTRGGSVYTLSERASDKEAAALAAKENKADVIGGIDLNNESGEVANILIDLAQRETMNLSAQLANLLIEEMSRKVVLLRNTHRFAGFAVLKAPDVPAVLVELGYLSNRTDEALLRKPSHRAKVAGTIVRAIDRYFRQVDKATRS